MSRNMEIILERQATKIAALEAQIAALDAAAGELLTGMTSHFKARNGRLVGVQGDDGEKVWLVHSDLITQLEAARKAPLSEPGKAQP